MKKVFLSFMMIAAAMMSFISCSKSDDDNSSISNAFKLDGSTYDLGYAMKTTVNVFDANHTVLVLSKSESDISNIVGFIFDGTEIQTGDIDLALTKMFAVIGNGSTSIEEMIGNAYLSTQGSAKITVNENKITITTSGVKMINKDPKTVDFELDYDGSFYENTSSISNAFKLDGSTYDLGYAMKTTVNVFDANHTVLVLSKSESDISNIVGFIFDGTEIQTGDIDLTLTKMFAVTGNTTTSPEELIAYMNEHAYFSTAGSAKITVNENKIIITTSGVKMTNVELAQSGKTVDFELAYDGSFVIPTPPTPPTATFTIDGGSHNIEFAGQVAYPLGEQIFSIAFFCEKNPLTTETTNVVALLFPTEQLPTGEFNVQINPTTMLSNMAYMTDFNIASFMADPMTYLTQAFMGASGNLTIQNNEGTHYNITSTGIVVANAAGTTHNLSIDFDGELAKLMK